jgi:serine/threonine-protein kinase
MTAGLSPADKLVGRVLAERYQILHRLGEGAMGIVYKARHVKVGRLFAVKVLHTRTLADPKVLRRFEREAELAGRLRHPNVVGVVDVGEVEGTRYMVMDFAEGPDLAKLLDEAPMPPERIIRLARQMLDGLHHAHDHGLIHRDFKPENVIIERDANGGEIPRIVDFGIALLRDGGESIDGNGRLTTNGLVLGTPHYMAPEQAVADPIDHRIDLFALGIVIYEMLSGRLPFDGSGAEVARANLLLDPPPINKRVPHLEVDPLLEAFSRRLMAKKRTARPATAKAARELLDAIERDRLAAAPLLGVPVAKSGRHQATEAVSAAEPAAPPQIDPPTTRMRQTPKQAAPAGPLGSHASDPEGAAAGAIAAPVAAPSDSGAAPGQAAAFAPDAGYEMSAPVSPAVVYVPPSAGVGHGYPGGGRAAGYGARRHRDTALRTPLGWQTASLPGRRRSWLIGGVAVSTASVIAAVVLALTGDPEGGTRTASGRIAAPSAAEAPPLPAAATTTNVQLPVPNPAEAAAAAISGNPVDASPTIVAEPSRSEPPIATPAPDSRSVATPQVTAKRVPPTPARVRPPAAAAPAASREPIDEPAPAPPPARTRSRAAETPDADAAPARTDPLPAVPTGISAAELGTLFDVVRHEIAQLPEASQHDLLDQLAMLNIMRAMRESQAARDEAASQLSRLRQRARDRRAGRP